MPTQPKTPNPNDILRLGASVATIKANMPKKRWAKFVKVAHARGFSIAGALSDQPDALKERTRTSLADEAKKTVATAYAPAQKSLTTRERAIGFLDDKRKADDASYRTWLIGETEKLNAQARAADSTLAKQQTDIKTETETAIAAARADSIKRLTDAGVTSNPNQSTALDTSAADAAATKHVEAARTQSADIMKIGGDARTIAGASLLAQQAAREASRQGDTWKAIGELAADRDKLALEQGAATLDKTGELINRNTQIVQTNREADLAAASLNLKKDDLAAQIKDADRKYKIETSKFELAKWKADNADKVAQAKLKLGYDSIASKEGIAAANRKLNIELAKIRAAEKDKKDKPKGVTSDERELYRAVDTVRGLFVRWDKNNAVPLAEREQHLRDMGYDDTTISVAHDLARNNGVLSPTARAQARKLGIKHSGYFWPPVNSPGASATPPGGNLGR